jgi:flagellar biosynthesis protein
MSYENISDKKQTAVALYFDGVNAPCVSASGIGLVGEKIIKIANEHNIPLHEDAGLASALSRIPLGDEIPFDLYLAVAEVLAFVYYLDGIRLSDLDTGNVHVGCLTLSSEM